MSCLKKFLFAALILSTAFLTRCGNKDSTPTVTANFSSIYTNVLSQTCIQCHVPGAPAHDLNGVQLDFSTAATAYSSLLNDNVSGMSSTGTCGGLRIVAPGAAASSYLAAVLFTDYNVAGFGNKPSCQPYANHISSEKGSTYEAAVVAWINAGALNN